ncbi:MAG TPA: fibronectin type III domain-containing protein [Candidatus Limnocylindrales bacterium]
MVAERGGVRYFELGPGNVHHLLLQPQTGSAINYLSDAAGAWHGHALFGQAGDLALDAAGNPYAAMRTAQRNNDPPVQIATNATGTWTAEDVIPYGTEGAGRATSTHIAFGPDGTLHVAWVIEQKWIYYRAKGPSGWGAVAEVDPAARPEQGTFGGMDLAVDAAGVPHFLVSGFMPNTLPDGVVEPPCTRGTYCLVDIVLDGAGDWSVTPLGIVAAAVRGAQRSPSGLSAILQSDTSISYAANTGSGWSLEPVASVNGYVASLDETPTGPVIFFSTSGQGNRRIDRGPSGWTFTELSTSNDAFALGAIDDAGNAHVAFSRARWYDLGGYLEDAFLMAPDDSAPQVGVPGAAPRVGTAIGATVPTVISWTALDDLSGVARYQLQQRTNGGAWVTLSSTLTARAAIRNLTPGTTTYQFRVRGWDRAGNASAWAEGPALRASRYEETSALVRYGGTWRRQASSGASGGATKYATARNASATFTVNGRAFAWVTPKGSSRGSAKVLVDGVWLATVNLYRSSTLPRVIAYSIQWPSTGTHTIKILLLGTSGHPRVDVDAFVVLR